VRELSHRAVFVEVAARSDDRQKHGTTAERLVVDSSEFDRVGYVERLTTQY